MHKKITALQNSAGLNTKNLQGISWRRNVLDNIEIMKKAGVPRNVILDLAKKTKQFAIDNGF